MRSMGRVLEWLVAGGIGALAGCALARRPSRRGTSRRHEHFLTQQGGSTLGISADSLHTSHLLLRAALEERRGGVWCSADNHATMHAPGVVVMIATSLDAWLSELIAFGRTSLGLAEGDVARVIEIGTVAEKYRHTATLLFQRDIRPSTDLEYVSRVRNEIVHFLPEFVVFRKGA
jgi:hypothetical protein